MGCKELLELEKRVELTRIALHQARSDLRMCLLENPRNAPAIHVRVEDCQLMFELACREVQVHRSTHLDCVSLRD